MIHQNDNDVEMQIDRALKRLPELQAPSSLRPRVLHAIANRASLPWYRCPWPTWPLALQAVSMSLLLGGFGIFVLAAWQLTEAAGYQAAWEEVKQLFGGFSSAGNLARLLLSAGVLTVKQLGTPFMAGCIVAALLGYSLFIGLGTIYLRVGLSLRRID